MSTAHDPAPKNQLATEATTEFVASIAIMLLVIVVYLLAAHL